MTREGLHIEPQTTHPPVFDFRSPERVPSFQIEGIRLVFEQCLRNMAAALTAYLEIPVHLRLVDIEQLTFSHFRDTLSYPTCLVDLRFTAAPHRAVMEMGLAVAFPIVEVLLGAKPGQSIDIQRELTEVEQHVISGVFRSMVEEMRQVLCNPDSGDLQIHGIVGNPKQMAVLQSDAGALVFTVEVDVAGKKGLLTLALPSSVSNVLDGSERRSSDSIPPACSETSSVMLNLVENSSVKLEVRLDGETLRMKDLLALKAGDVVGFDHDFEQLLQCTVNGLLAFRGHLVAKGAKKVFCVEACEQSVAAAPATRTPLTGEQT